MEMRALCLALCSCCVLVMPLKQSTVQSPSKLSAECGRQVILNCPITHGANYLRITWYKLVNNTPHTMLMRSDGKKDSLKADDDGKFQMDANESLIIREVQVEDAGMYRCSLRAPVGHQNMDMDSNLIVPGKAQQDILQYQEANMQFVGDTDQRRVRRILRESEPPRHAISTLTCPAPHSML
ncbi:uncharacterized protein [Ambystoma mexicanum]|uniref:uncharacterized protein isoform X2 n=1 Tax=Ambystoma mexicanum TaxID=8296 RepID=UPI0037E88B56